MSSNNDLTRSDKILFNFHVFATAFLLYFAERVLPIYLIFTLFLFWRSSRPYIWIAYTLLINLGIAGLFGGDFRLFVSDMVNIGPLSISYLEVFSILSLFKVMNISRNKYFIKKQLNLYFIYFVFLIILGVFKGTEGLGHSGFRNYFLISKMLIVLPLFFTMPRLISNSEQFINFSKLIFPFAFINLVGQLIHMYSGTAPIYIFRPDLMLEGYEYAGVLSSSITVRPVWGHFVIFVIFCCAFYFYIENKNIFSKFYLLSIIFVTYVSIFLGATRGWILSFTFMFFAIVLIYAPKKQKFNLITVTLIGLITYWIVQSLFPVVNLQTNQVINRLNTLEALAKGDVSLEGTNFRLTTRHEKVMELFYESPICGNGFSTEAIKRNDPHVGNQNILMSGGIIGFILIFTLWISIILKVRAAGYLTDNTNSQKKVLKLLIVYLLGLIMIHSSSSALFGYLLYLLNFQKIFLIALILSIFNIIINTAELEQNRIGEYNA